MGRHRRSNQQSPDANLAKNIKQKVRKELHPVGHSFEAVRLLKSTLDEKDPLFVYEVNDNKFNNYLCSTSKEKMQLAAKMNRDGDSPFKSAILMANTGE